MHWQPEYRHTRALIAPLLLISLYSCTTKTNATAPSLNVAPFIHFEYAVYLPADEPPYPQPMTAVVDSLRVHPGLKLEENLPKEPQDKVLYAHVNPNVRDGYAPPHGESLKYSGHGLGSQETEALQKSTRALVLDFAHPRKDAWPALLTATKVVDDIARKTNGFIWDEETREVFTPAAWRNSRLAPWTKEIPRISTQITIHLYDTGHSQRAISLGMAKMGLPDLVVEDSAQHSRNEIGNLINLVAQAMAEGRTARKSGEFRLTLSQIKDDGMRQEMTKSLKPNATAAGCLALLPAKWEDGDPQNRLLQLAFDKYPGPDQSARQEAMLDSFFGFEDPIHYVKHDDALLAASAEARNQLPALHKAMASFQPGEYLEVKAPFTTESGGNEWMWVEVRKWEGNRITGLLDNDPEAVRSLHAGQQVEVQQEDIFDYIHTFPDKRTEGNKTSVIMKRMQETRNAGTPDFKPIVPPCDGN